MLRELSHHLGAVFDMTHHPLIYKVMLPGAISRNIVGKGLNSVGTSLSSTSGESS